MRQCSQRDEIYAGSGDSSKARGIGANVARGLDQHTGSATAHQFHRAVHHFDMHVVEQDDICTGCQGLVYFHQCFALDFDLEQVGSQAASGIDGCCDAPGRLDVVVLDENAIAQAEAVIVTAARPYSILLQAAQTWRRLARIKDARPCAFDGAYTARGDGGDAGEMTEKIQGHTLSAQLRAGRAT